MSSRLMTSSFTFNRYFSRFVPPFGLPSDKGDVPRGLRVYTRDPVPRKLAYCTRTTTPAVIDIRHHSSQN